jgi:hypothetical protein
MRRHVVPREANRAHGVRTVKIVTLTVCAAFGLAWAGASAAHAQNYSTHRNYSSARSSKANATYAQVKPRDGSIMERKCMILPCGSQWCYLVKR